MTQEICEKCIQCLKEELIPAFGCTEPIALALCAAKARQVLGCIPEQVHAYCSGNIIKNVKGVVVPATGNLIGIPAAVAIGIAGGNPDAQLQVLQNVTEADIQLAAQIVEKNIIQVSLLETDAKLHIRIEMKRGTDSVLVEMMHTHTGIVKIVKNGEILLDCPCSNQEQYVDEHVLDVSFDDIFDFGANGDLREVLPILEEQVRYNTSISMEGLRHPYGAQVGRTLVETYGDSNIEIFAQAAAAAGSDARMGGCEMPVIINSGSGNQGLTVCLPVVAFARKLGVPDETMYRAVCISNLTAIYQRSQIGRLSAFCGVTNASAGAAAGIAFLLGATAAQAELAVSNTLANVSGIVCDGAKASCAAKIAACVHAAELGVHMAMKERYFLPGQGLVKNNVDATIKCVAKLANDGMKETDQVILNLMIS